jgi:hypothetical protein
MQTNNIIDISELPLHYRTLALDFMEYLKFKSKKSSSGSTNFDKDKLRSAFKDAQNPEIFKQISDSVSWQKELRDEWE